MKKILLSIWCLLLVLAGCNTNSFKEYGSRPEALADFALLMPATNTYLQLNASAPATSVDITWQKSSSGLDVPGTTQSNTTYEWLLDRVGGDFSAPLLTLASNNTGKDTKITLTHQQIETALGSVGIAPKAKTDFIWSVRATNGTKSFKKLAFAPFNISIKRFDVGVSAFTITAPADEAILYLNETAPTAKAGTITWVVPTTTPAGQALTYKWVAVERTTTGDFSRPSVMMNLSGVTVTGANASADVTNQQFDDALRAAGYPVAGKADLSWAIVATAGGLDMLSTNYNDIAIFRFGAAIPVKFELANYPASTPANGKIFLAGKFGFAGYTPAGDWQQPGTVANLELIKNATTGSYEITIPVPVNRVIDEFKFFFVPNGTSSSWSYGERRFNFAGAEEGMPNRSWTFMGTNTNPKFSVAKWEGIGSVPAQLSKFEVTVDAAVTIPAGKSVYLAGEISGTSAYSAYFAKSGNWAQPGTNPANEMMFDSGSGKWFIWLPIGAAGNKEFKPFVASGDAPFWDSGMGKADCTGESNQSFVFSGTNGPSINVVRFQKVAPCPL